LSVEEFCEQIVVVRTLDDQLGQIETLEIEDTFAELEALTAEAPAEVQPSLEILTDYTGQVVEVMVGVEPGDVDAADEALTDLDLSEDERARAEQAGREVEVYTQENCLFDLRSGGTLPPPTTAPPTTAAPESTGTTAAG